MSALYGCKVLLGVSGGIAAYKSPDLVRRLRERGAEVQVVMTAGAQRFVTPTTFQAVSGREVRADVWDPAAEAAMGHNFRKAFRSFVVGQKLRSRRVRNYDPLFCHETVN